MATSTVKLVIALLMVAVQDVSSERSEDHGNSMCRGFSQLGRACLGGAGICTMVSTRGRYGHMECIVDCGSLNDPDNGEVDVSGGTHYPDVATYSCDTGYTLNGVATRPCLITGVWKGTVPTCSLVDCGFLNVTNGDVDVPGGTEYQNVATYSCYAGYELNGETTRTCLATGVWNGTATTCDPIPIPLVECLPKNVTVDMVNVALNKPVTLSSLNKPSQTGDRATDGNYSGVGPDCAHTDVLNPSHITVDLGVDVNIHAIYIFNRQDCCAYRLHDVKVQLATEATPGDFEDVMFHAGSVGGDCFFYLPTGSVGRHVRFTRNGLVAICELEVYTIV